LLKAAHRQRRFSPKISTCPWHLFCGARDNQACVALNVTSNDGDKTLNGTNTYSGEGPIGFKGALA